MNGNETGLKDYAKVKFDANGEVIKTTEDVLVNAKELVENQLSSISMTSGSDVVAKAISENKAIANIIKNALVEGSHYGVIPGTSTKTLLQPGADVLARTYGIEVEFDLVDKDYDPTISLLDFTYKATAYWRGQRLTSAEASANSLEQKFRSHFQEFDKELGTYKDRKGKSLWDIKNTIQQMAQKRAKVRVIRTVLGITGEFTQDVEDMQDAKASKDDVFSVYNELYIYIKAELGKNDTERKNFLKLNVLKPLCMELQIPGNIKVWTNEHIEKLIANINDREKVEALIAKGLEVK